jgi:hypothetical protein
MEFISVFEGLIASKRTKREDILAMVSFVRHVATQKTNNRTVATFVIYVGRHFFAFYLPNPFIIRKSDIDLHTNWYWKAAMDCF